MLNEKQFRERASRQMREIGNQVLALATDRELYRKFEAELAQASPELTGSNGFVELIRGSYTDALTMRLRRLVAPEANLSLRRTIVQLSDYPDLLHEKVNTRELAKDAGTLDKTAADLKVMIEPHFLPRERTPGALAPAHRDLDGALDLLIELLQKYYWVVCGGHLSFEVKVEGEVLAGLR
jgi:hypothetical protein